MSSEPSVMSSAARFGVLNRVMALAEFDMDGQLLHANANYLAILQLDPLQWQGRTHQSFCAPELVGSADYGAMWACLRQGQTFSGVVERVRSDGSPCWLEAMYSPVANAQGVYTHVVKVATDITERHLRELEQQASLRLLSLVAGATDTAVLISDARSRIVYVNEGFSRMFGWTLDEITERAAIELLAPQKPPHFIDHYRNELRTDRSIQLEEIVTGKDGQRYWAKVMSNPVCDAAGQWEYTVTVLTDITSTKMHEVLQHRVMEAMARDRPLMEVPDMVCEEVERIAPEVSASILRVDSQGLLHPLASPSLPFSYSSLLDGVPIGPNAGSCGTAAWRKEPVLVSDIATDPLWADFKALILPLGYKACWSTPIMDKDGAVTGTFAFYYRDSGAGVASDYHRQLVNACTHLCALAMEREQARLRIRQLAFYDALTGLPNRSLLQAKAEQVLATAERADQKAAVLFIDLDRFKQVYDSLGHPAGDELLCVVASRVKEVLRHSDI
ncbi:MAG: PAS domain-containing protein, partial [Comamonas sp.]|nr:PAS domain-containing protein [Candidatus Comamonas equi]